MGRLTKNLRIEGSVQGVGFRYSFCFAAKRAGVTGWVRNRRDGSVEAIVQGDERAVNEVITWAHRGPDAAQVENVTITDASGEFSDFSIRDSA